MELNKIDIRNLVPEISTFKLEQKNIRHLIIAGNIVMHIAKEDSG
jgi:hypothetical protein